MLRHDVVDAVKKGLFRIYAIKSIDEGLQVLTGKPAGKRLPNGGFTTGSVHALVNARLAQFAKAQKRFGGS